MKNFNIKNKEYGMEYERSRARLLWLRIDDRKKYVWR